MPLNEMREFSKRGGYFLIMAFMVCVCTGLFGFTMVMILMDKPYIFNYDVFNQDKLAAAPYRLPVHYSGKTSSEVYIVQLVKEVPRGHFPWQFNASDFFNAVLRKNETIDNVASVEETRRSGESGQGVDIVEGARRVDAGTTEPPSDAGTTEPPSDAGTTEPPSDAGTPAPMFDCSICAQPEPVLNQSTAVESSLLNVNEYEGDWARLVRFMNISLCKGTRDYSCSVESYLSKEKPVFKTVSHGIVQHPLFAMIGYGCSGAVLLVATVLVGLAVDSSMIPLFAFCSYFSLLVVMAYAEAGGFLHSLAAGVSIMSLCLTHFFLYYSMRDWFVWSFVYLAVNCVTVVLTSIFFGTLFTDISPFLQSVVEHALLGFALVLNFFLIWALIQVMGHMTIHFEIEEMHRRGGNIRLQSSDRGMYVHGTRADMGRYNRLGM